MRFCRHAVNLLNRKGNPDAQDRAVFFEPGNGVVVIGSAVTDTVSVRIEAGKRHQENVRAKFLGFGARFTATETG